MTATSPSSRAARPRPARRIGVRPALLAVATLAIAALLVAPWSAASAQAADQTPTPSPTPTFSGTVTPVLAPFDSGLVRAGDPLNAWVTLRNGTAYSLDATTVTLSLGSAAIGDRASLAAWLAGSADPGGLVQVG